MLFHVSLEADDPRRVAHALARIFGGEALPFPAVIGGSWVALAGDDRGTMIEIYPRGTELRPGAPGEGAHGVAGAPRRFGAAHIAIATRMDREEVEAVAREHGWRTQYCRRGGRFGLIELWVENCLMVEVLTPPMQREYLDTITIPNWRRMLEETGTAQTA